MSGTSRDNCTEEDLLRFISSRRSSKLLGEGEVPLEKVLRALEVACTAPSAHNAQPWRVVVIRDRQVLTELLEAMAEEWRRDLRSDGFPEWKVEAIVRESMRRTLRASVVVVVCMTMGDMDRYPDERRNGFERVMAIQSVAAFIQNLLLALHAMGLGACWRCGPLFAPDAVKRVLGLPEDFEPQALIEIGLPGGTRDAERKPLSEIAALDRWGRQL
ncbi:MAG: nitroreductase family protein [Nitrososphaerota archaeon]